MLQPHDAVEEYPDMEPKSDGGRVSIALPFATVTLLFVLLHAITWRVQLIGDSQAHLFLGASLAWSGDFDLLEFEEALRNANGGELPYFVFESGNCLRSIFNIMPGVLLAPFYFFWGLFSESFHTDLIQWGHVGRFVALLFLYGCGFCVWRLLWQRVGGMIASIAVIALWFGSAFWATSIDYLQHQPAAFFRAAAILALFGVSRGFVPSPWRCFVAGLSLALAVLCRYQTAPAMAIVAAACGWSVLKETRQRLAFAAGLLVLAPPTLWYHWRVFGGLFRIGPTLALQFDSPFFATFFSLLFNPSKGILIHSPWVILGALAFIRGSRAREAEAGESLLPRICLLSIVPTLLLYSKLNGWFAGWSWGWRYLLDAAPELTILFAIGTASWWGSRIVRIATFTTLSMGVAIQALGALTYDGDWHRKHDLGIAPSQAWLWQVRHGQILYGVRRGIIYLGPRAIAWREDPFEARGVFRAEQWGEKSVCWTEPHASFLFVAVGQPTHLRVYAPPLDMAAAQVLDVSINGSLPTSFPLVPDSWNDVELSGIPYQHSVVITLQTQPPYLELGPAGRKLGIAVDVSQRAAFPSMPR